MDSKHGIQKHYRRKLTAVMKIRVYAKSKEEFNDVWENIQASALTDIPVAAGRYIHSR